MENRFLKIMKYIILTSFVTFFSLYISQKTGYFEYKNNKKTVLTAKQIELFEKDVKQGKKTDLKKYLEANNKHYSNKISKTGLSISKITEKIIQKSIDKTFKLLSKLVGDE